MNSREEKEQTIKTYYDSSSFQAEKFNQIGARVEDIKKTFSFIKKDNPRVIELGCGNGRDAKEMIKLTSDYLGIDLSEGMLKLARKNVPEAVFKLADMESYQFPQGIDIVFAFASLLHCDRENVRIMLQRIYESLNHGGVLFISSKLGDYHKETLDKDGQGMRTYYFYSPKEITDLSPNGFQNKYEDLQNFNNQDWFSIILQKTNQFLLISIPRKYTIS